VDRGHVGAGGGFAVGVQLVLGACFADLTDLSGIEDRVAVVFDPGEQALIDDVCGHRGFECRVADEEDDGSECGFGKCEEVHERADVELVLVKRILEPAFLPIDLLGPLALFFVTKDPAFVVFCFDHEDAEWGNDDVVELGGALAIGTREVEVVEGAIGFGIKLCQALGDGAFAEPAFKAGGGEDLDDDENED